jgi:glucose/arabinose dehydrogenase
VLVSSSSLLSAALAVAALATAAAPPAVAKVGLKKVGSFDQPVWVTAPPGDTHRLFVVEKTGRIRVVKNGRKLARPFLSLRGQVATGSEQGLLSLAFSPDYTKTGRFYIDFTDRQGNSHVTAYRRSRGNPDVASPNTARRVLYQRQPEENHNGGLLVFGPDRHLYIGFGDGGGGGDEHGLHGNAQNLGIWLGKILRIDPVKKGRRAYTVPASNPFVHRAGARPEIYDFGLRNPWRFSFDRLTNDMTIGDVGQDTYEEIDFARRGHTAGINYGWRVFEAFSRFNASEAAPGARRPVLAYKHGPRCSITGGYVVRDRSLGSLYGSYVYGDFCDGVLRAATLHPGGVSGRRLLGLTVPGLTSFGQDPRGRVYALSITGPVYRLVSR